MDKGLKLLFSTYWSGGMWGRNAPTAEDYRQAKAEGYMFDPAPALSHDETLRELQCILEKIAPEDVANAFLYSLSTRQLQYRSALGSYYYAISIPKHSHTGSGACYFCNWLPIGGAASPEREHSGYNIFNFERYKWGGIRHTHPEYALFDLEQFLRLPKVTPTQEDRAILKSILDAAQELPPRKKAGAYHELITKKRLIKSNKNEIEALLDILGICGILSSKEFPCYYDRFMDVYGRSPKENTNDFAYPINCWYASDGINEERFLKVFGCQLSDF